jgi:hypothetical protein
MKKVAFALTASFLVPLVHATEPPQCWQTTTESRFWETAPL